MFCLGVITGDIEKFTTTLTDDIKQCGENFLNSLKGVSITAQDESLQSFLFALFSQKNRGAANKYAFLTFCFLVLYSFTEHGTLYKCSDFSQFFSKVVFFGRSTIFKRILSDAERDNKGFYE